MSKVRMSLFGLAFGFALLVPEATQAGACIDVIA